MPVITPRAEPQKKAARSKAGLLVYGGGAGGGKSWYASYRASKYHRVAHYNACLFRRTFTMLQGSGSLWDECMGFYPALGAHWTTRPLEFTWNFPSRVEFRHLQHETSAHEHKSKQYSFINFDEASDFLGSQFWFMNSRLRSIAGTPKQFLLTTNPDPDCYLRKLIDWWIGSDGYPIPERDGVIRYFVRVKDELVWASDPKDLLKYVKSELEIESITFIRSLVTDNVVLMEKDPGYAAKLRSLPEVERARFEKGNWNVKESSGDMFQAAWCKLWGSTDLERALMGQDGHPNDVVQSVRWWDFAATPVLGDLVPGVDRPADFKARDPANMKDDPDWTYGVRLDRLRNGRVLISDVVMYRDTPGAIEYAMERIAMEDGPRVVQGWWQDPGQASISQTEKLAARIGKHSAVVMEPASKSKLEYAREPSRAMYRGEFAYCRGRWNSPFFNQLQAFPPDKKEHDDAVDALSGAFHYLQSNAPAVVSDAVVAGRMRDAGLHVPGLNDFMYAPNRESRARDHGSKHRNTFGRRIL